MKNVPPIHLQTQTGQAPHQVQKAVQNQVVQQMQLQQQQAKSANNPFMGHQSGATANTSAMHAEKGAQTASYFPAHLQNGPEPGARPSNYQTAAAAYQLWERMIKGEAVSPTQQMKQLGYLYKYLKKFFPDLQEEMLEEGELPEGFESMYDILNWFQSSRHIYLTQQRDEER